MNVLLLLVSFAIILAGAMLFTNAVEWLGRRLRLAEGAVGSILAAVGTAMPETLIPIVAIIGGAAGSHDVAVGAIVGAPFLLATVAMALIGLAAMSYARRRPSGRKLDVQVSVVDRDLVFFMTLFTLVLMVGLTPVPGWAEVLCGILLLVGYIIYVRVTINDGRDSQAAGHELGPLIMDRRSRRDASPPPDGLIGLQIMVGLGAMVGGAHLFVQELLEIAASLGVSAIVLSLILAPLATELPEKANSYFWVREGKDSLALGNITGAMVFQASIPVTIGMIFVPWKLDSFAALSMTLALIGAAMAWWGLRRRSSFTWLPILGWAVLYLIFLGYVLVVGG